MKWIIDETENIFKENKITSISLDSLYMFLRRSFKTFSFNRVNLKKLFRIENALEYKAFVSVRDKALEEYKLYCNDNFGSSKPGSQENTNKIIHLVFPKTFLNSNIKWLTLSPEEIEMKNNLQLAKEDMGEKLCEHFLKNINEAQYLYKVLSDYILEEKKTRSLKIAIENINNNLMEAKVKPLLSVYNNKYKDDIHKFCVNNNILYVKDLYKVLNVPTNTISKTQLISFIEWLSDNKVEALIQDFKKIFKSERDKFIIKMRAAGKTLEETGQEVGITRERVRQIEQKKLKRFNRFLTIKKPHHILKAYTQNSGVLRVDTIQDYLGELSSLFIYCFKKSNSNEAMWCDKIKGFVVGDPEWYKQLSEYMCRLPDMFETSALEDYVFDVKNMLDVEVEPSIIRELITTDFYLYGKVYTKRKISKVDVYLTVLDRFYPEGIKLYDDFEMMRFRNYVKTLFGDIDLPENNRSMCIRIADITVLCDRGKYILPSKIKCDDEILETICQFIEENPRNVIMFGELFERFKTELLAKTNINNRFFLQGVLKHKYATEFFFTKDTLIKDINNEQDIDIKLSIEKFIKKQARIVTRDEIKEEFLGISDAVLQVAIANNPNILLWGFGSYLHVEQININKATKDRFKKILDDYTTEGSVSVRKIFNEIYLSENDFMFFNNINGYAALFSVFYYLFPNDFEFSRPYIAFKGSTALTFNAILQEYLSDFDEIYISDFKDYIESIRRGNFSISLLLDDISDEFIRIDSDLLVRKDRLILSEEIIKSIEEVTLALIGDTGYLSLVKMDDYIFYPNIGFKWTPFLLVSMIKNYCNKLMLLLSLKINFHFMHNW